MSSIQLDHSEDIEFEELQGSVSSELERVEECRELEQIYNKLIITSKTKPNFAPPLERTLIPGAHARKLGIRLKTAKQLSEKRQTTTSHQQRIKTANPRLTLRTGTAKFNREDIVVTPLPTDMTPRVRAGTAFPTKASQTGLPSTSNRQSTKSAPASRVRTSAIQQAVTARLEPTSPRPDVLPTYSSLAMYSPQSQRFTIEQLAMEQTRLLRRLSHIQTHRVDKGFYVSGAPCDLREKYNIDDEQYSLLMDVTNKGKRTNKKITGLSLSQSILQHFSPQPQRIKLESQQIQTRKQSQSKRVSIQLHNTNIELRHNETEGNRSNTHRVPSPTQAEEMETTQCDDAAGIASAELGTNDRQPQFEDANPVQHDMEQKTPKQDSIEGDEDQAPDTAEDAQKREEAELKKEQAEKVTTPPDQQ